jgi:hypothetical protein
MRNKYPF